MSTTQRRTASGLIDALLRQPHGFEFFQAVRLFELAGAMARLRFHNRLSLAFPPNQIENLSSDDSDGDIHMTPAFMGMLGSQGVLPLHYTERITSHERSGGDGGPRAFLDMLSHGVLTLFYRAWAKHRPECMIRPDGGDAFLTMMTALSGAHAVPGVGGGAYVAGSAGAMAEHRVEPETLARYAMQIRSRAVSAPLMAGVYAEHFDVPFALEQLVGAWQPLPARQQARLGEANVDLDGGVLLGARIYRCDERVRLRIGPLDRERFNDFLPGRAAAVQLSAMLGLHCGVGMTYEVHLILRAPEVRGAHLGAGCQLAVNTWLIDKPSSRDRDELMYLLYT